MTQQEKNLTEIRPRFVVETPPYLHRGYTISGMMRDTFIALLPAAAMAVYYFGIPALRVMCLAAGVCALTEALWQKALGQTVRVYDCTALITGLLFAFLLPAGAPWWLVVVGSVLTIVLGKQVFGGLGCNPLCPALVGWASMTVAWPTYMDPMAMNLTSAFIDPLVRMKFFGWEAMPLSAQSLLLGRQLGGLGSAQIGAVLLGGLYMVARKTVRWEIPTAFLVGVLFFGAIFWQLGEAMGVNPASAPPPHLYLLTGSTLFAAFFLATDHASSPVAFGGMVLYGLLCGLMVVLIRIFGYYPDGAPFAVLVTALVTPMFDLIRSAPYGKGRR
ncbi:MAG: RnfABCDGE type electron transport complex subunit D [Desulfovibrio sp.]|jgi:electron transport complex protein RnfD|nr:RnfABCDGE type electron transport complex subunit D [Desulfovibrio sp.]